MMAKNKADYAWGIERTPGLSFGDLVCPTINLFEKPFGKFAKMAIAHGEEVKILDVEHVDYRTWYKVETLGEDKNSGWVLSSILKKRGKPSGGQIRRNDGLKD